jgi:predicted negative regulator of RcsB-dependent stress response
VSELRTEEEQVEAIKSWWKSNGTSLVTTVAIALAAVFGWKAWQQKQLNDAEAASVAYQSLTQAVALTVRQPSEDNKATALHLANELKTEHEGTEYARLAALMLARVYVDQSEYELALNEIEGVLAQDLSPEMKNVATLRKAQLLLAQDKFNEALTAVDQVDAEAFKASALELKGDIQVAQGDKDAARNAYQSAIDALGPNANAQLITIKLNDLAVEES